MKITLNARTVFRFPTGLILNRFTASLIRRNLKKEGIRLTRRQTARLIKEIKWYQKNHADWNLAEIREAGGRTVQIKI